MRPVARIAQSVEQGIENPRVGGSIPSPGTTNTEKPQAKLNSLGFFLACDLPCPAECPRFAEALTPEPDAHLLSLSIFLIAPPDAHASGF
jgi:hypothetical protein